MDPFTLILGLVSLGLNAAGSVSKARALKQESEYQSAVASLNARNADRAAGDAVTRGQTEEGYARMKTSEAIGESRAAYGASGVDGSVGSPLHAMMDARMIGEMDAQTLRSNAAREAWGYATDASNYRREAEFAKKRGENALTATFLGGAGDAFAGGSSLAMKAAK